MVSGFVTSPCDHDMIVSGDASESFSASKFSSFSKFFSLPLSLFRRVFPELFALEADAEVQRDLGDVKAPRNLRFRWDPYLFESRRGHHHSAESSPSSSRSRLIPRSNGISGMSS